MKILKINFYRLVLLAFLLFLFLIIPNIAIGASSYVVQEVGSDQILISDGFSQYIVEYGFDCFESDFFEGDTIYIDSSGYIGYGDTIILNNYSNDTCDVTDSEEVDLEKYFVKNVLDSNDQIIVEDDIGTQYLVEYGVGCGLSFWRYENDYINIDVGGAFLDGIGDKIYLLDDGDDCSVWDSEEISDSGSSYGSSGSNSNYSIEDLKSTLEQTNCPANSSYSNGDCVCNDDYLALDNECVEPNDYCSSKINGNVHYDSSEEACYCDSGYVYNEDQNKCISGNSYCEKSFSSNSEFNSSENKCECKSGYSLNSSGDSCVSKSQECREKYGLSSIYNEVSESCECKENFVFNDSGERCVHKDSYCRVRIGVNSYYTNDKECVCDEGYKMESGECKKIQRPSKNINENSDLNINKNEESQENKTSSENNGESNFWLFDFIKSIFT